MGKNTVSKVSIRPHLIVRPSLRRAQPRRGSRRVEVSGSRKRGMQEFEPSGSKRTIRGDLIEERGSHEVWYGGDGPCREATPCFGTQPHCLQVQLARHCLLANEPGASVAPSEVWCRRRDSNPHGFPHTPLKRACLPVPPLRRWPDYRSASKRLSINCLSDRIPANTWRWRPL